MSGPHDLFICHTPASVAPVKRLTAALAARGTSCFAFEAGHGAELQPKLATAKAMLVWASEDFFRSRSCQAHLAMAVIARRQELPATPERILIVNAETGLKHIYPMHLRDRIIASAPGLPDAPDLTTLAERLQQRCAALTGSLGGLYPIIHSGWVEPYDRLSHGPAHFAGRERELWDIHDALHPPADSVTDRPPVHFVVVSGAPGHGKSTLTREYAFRFGAAYPGGIYRLSAQEARPAARLRELAENPALKPQLLGLLRQINPDMPLDDHSTIKALLARLGELISAHGQPFLWIVDDLPDGINGPVLRQWLAPVLAGKLGRTIVITHGQRYDHRAEPIHLPILDEQTGAVVLTRGKMLVSGQERDAVDWLLEEVGRHPRFAAMVAALAEDHRRHRRATYAWLLQKLEKQHRHATRLTAAWAGEFPEGYEIHCASILLDTLSKLEGPARDILRLAAALADHDLPLEFVAECLVLSGLSADEHKEDPFTIFLNEPEDEPLAADAARDYVEQGATSLVTHALAERTDGGIRIYRLAAEALAEIVPASPRQSHLREAALQALYVIAESCHQSNDWLRLAAVAPHGRKLIEDLRDRPIEAEDSPSEITGRIRLALHLADLDLRHGARQRAMLIYRAASAYLIRAMAVDPHNSARQRDFARVQEQLGDLLEEQGDLPAALDHYRKSLGLRAFMAKQEPQGLERIHDSLRLHTKIGNLQQARNDLESALQSQQAAHGLLAKLAQQAPADPALRFDLASSHARIAELYIGLDEPVAAMSELEQALPIFGKLADAHADQVRYARAPATIHNRIGDILRARDDLSGALNHYRTALAIADHATRLDPGDPEWQRDVAVCHNHIGDTLAGLDDLAEAAGHFQAFLAIAENPANSPAFAGIRRRDIAVVEIKLGRGRETAKELDAALEHYQKARAIIEQLAIELPENTLLREDLGWLRNRIERLKERREAELRWLARKSAAQAKPQT
ncbi:MAG: ATP-binding protein [Methylococcaceae bacterium]|nr:ATP-binding protein [Methylococcaceae bacterium]